jgi:endonuclease/exonuclease/phosphatase family metal-dependent hydrolase
MAKWIKDAHIIALQEIQIDEDGKLAVQKLADELSLLNGRWGFTISESTNGKGVEKYAFLWRTDLVKLIGTPYLEKSFASYADREPFIAQFKHEDLVVRIANFHAVPKKKEPWWEIKELHRIDEAYKIENLIFVGDFNLSQEDRAFNKIKSLGYKASLENTKTTIKMEPKGDEKFANDYDNIFYPSQKIKLISAGRIDFTVHFTTLLEARKISDHVPVWVILK